MKSARLSVRGLLANGLFALVVAASLVASVPLEAPGAEPEAGARKPESRKPNIILIVADDLGYGSVGCQGQKDVPTPAIDSLAQNGVRFTNGYVSCPVCSPTRAGLLTGRYQQRFGHELNPGGGPEGVQPGLPLSERTLADRLKALGYSTGIVGKWHLGNEPEQRPARRGFDSFFGFLGGAHSYLDPTVEGRNAVRRGDEPVDEKEYLTDAFNREALSFVEKHRKEPFFLYLTYNAVHTPMHAAPRHAGRFEGISDARRRTFASMISAMDEGIGRLLEKLRACGIEESSLVFFISDNGGPTRSNTSRNDPLRGFKGQVLEGGIRIPFIVQWKGKIPAGKVYDSPVISLDIAPTALAAAGGKTDPGFDGTDLLPYLTGANAGAPHETLFWRFGEQGAARQGKWKLVKLAGAPPQLYDLAADVGETKDLAASEKEVFERLLAAWKKWDGELVKPLWGGRGEQAAGTPKKKAKKRQ
jgi:arylsulfatase A-like enzyme